MTGIETIAHYTKERKINFINDKLVGHGFTKDAKTLIADKFFEIMEGKDTLQGTMEKAFEEAIDSFI